jgi:hypothetical protein
MAYADDEVHLGLYDGRTRKIIIRLNGDDHYDLEYGKIKGRGRRWVVLGRRFGIWAEALGDVLVEMAEQSCEECGITPDEGGTFVRGSGKSCDRCWG